jgi:RND family efflux transporter MFP subunit
MNQRESTPRTTHSTRVWTGSAIALAAALLVAGAAFHQESSKAGEAPARLPNVGVSAPLKRELESQLVFLGQYSAVDKVELRAQVGGTLTAIGFKDGAIVHKGDLLFTIDAEPYQIRLSQAQAQLEAARARLDLAVRELGRAETLKSTDAGSAQNVEQRTADRLAAQAAVDGAQAQVRDARFDLEHTRITAPFTGRIGNHQISVGNLVSGSRGGVGATTLLTTIVSLDPIHLDFDMSEADNAAYARGAAGGSDKVTIAQGDSFDFAGSGTLDFIDNTLDRSSGTIHARATISNRDLSLTPGGFARVRLATTAPQPALLVPDAAVLDDQTDHIVYVVNAENVATPRKVQIGDLRGGLRVIRSGLAPTDRVVIDGIPSVHPGSKISPRAGSIEFSAEQVAEGAKS